MGGFAIYPLSMKNSIKEVDLQSISLCASKSPQTLRCFEDNMSCVASCLQASLALILETNITWHPATMRIL